MIAQTQCVKMSNALFTGSSDSSFNLCNKHDFSTKRSVGEFSSSCVFFNTQSPKRSLSIENRIGSFRTKATMNSGVATVTKQSSFYQLLGISENGSFVEIKQAYKQLARKYHPDVSPPERVKEHTRRFIEVQEAYETLSDPKTRALYDKDLARGLHLAFSARKQYKSDEVQGFEKRSEWRHNWEDQLAGLKKKSMNKKKIREETCLGPLG